MDRQIIYPNQIPYDTDQLNQSKNTLVGLGTALAAILGSSTLVDGLTCQPTSPASLQFTISRGSIYSNQVIDATAYGSIAADTTHTIVKQGIYPNQTTFTTTAPTTSGQSMVYLIEATYADVDGGSTVLPYYNSANPAVPYSGPANSGAAQNTIRQGQCLVQMKAGTPATTGSQTAPAVDTGFTALWQITVAYGQTTITTGNIAVASGAPFLNNKLPQLAPLASPAFTGSPNAPTASPGDNSGLLANTAFVHTAVGTPIRSVTRQVLTSSGQYTPNPNMIFCDVKLVGGGGGGGGAAGGTAPAAGAGAGGGGGGSTTKLYTAAQLGIAAGVSIGAAGTAASAGNNNGTAGGASVFGPAGSGPILTANGGGGGTGSPSVSSNTPSGSGGAGGTSSGGDYNFYGQSGKPGYSFGPASTGVGGAGGDSELGRGGRESFPTDSGGQPATSYGGGGSGGASSSVSHTGGTPTQGICIVTEYNSV